MSNWGTPGSNSTWPSWRRANVPRFDAINIALLTENFRPLPWMEARPDPLAKSLIQSTKYQNALRDSRRRLDSLRYIPQTRQSTVRQVTC